MRVVIMGASRLASTVADLLEKDGHKLVVIDIDEAGFNRLSPNYAGEKIIGSGTNPDIYKKINFSAEDIFLAATNSENVNIAAAKMVQETFNCQSAYKVIYDPKRAKAFNEVEKGIICPILDAAIVFKNLIAT